MKGDKKKLIVVIALALVIVCVGVFQFAMGGSAPAPAPTVKKEEKKQPAPDQAVQQGPKNPAFAAALPARDPFEEPSSIAQAEKKPNPAAPTPPQPTPKMDVEREPRHPRLPPPDFGLSGSLPNAPLQVQALPEPKFAFTLSGVMLGAKPMAVFTDGQGNQRLVMLGGSLDPDSKVISIDKEAVTVRFHGKTLRLTVEGNPNAK